MVCASIRFTVAVGTIDKLRDVLLTVLGPTKALSGCISCRLYQEEGNPNSWLLLEEWASDEDMERHVASPIFHRVLEAMELSSQAPEVKFSTVAKTEGYELIENIRS